MAVSKIQTGLRLEESVYEKMKTLSKMEGRSLNNLIEHIIRQYLEGYEAKNGVLPPTRD